MEKPDRSSLGNLGKSVHDIICNRYSNSKQLSYGRETARVRSAILRGWVTLRLNFRLRFAPMTVRYRGMVMWSSSASLVSITLRLHTLCLKNVPTFKLFVTWSSLNRFSNFCTAGKHMRFAIKPIYVTHLNLGMLLHYLGISKIQIFSQYSADTQKCKQIAFSVHRF